ncbi:MAG: hypothetical protein K2J42_04705 [Muribaculaceae bacterium]|nr:hypothetical protein [Muribaculaceae bacterium]
MEFYLTPNATSYYPTPLSQTIWIIDKSIQHDFSIIFSQSNLGNSYNINEQLDIPVFFVTEEDLGKVIPDTEFKIIESKGATFKLPEKIHIPNERQFGYKADKIEQIFKRWTDQKALQNPNNGIMFNSDNLKESSDWLGLYCGFGSHLRCIFIRIDKIMAEPLLNNSIGVASVVIHELGHAMMDDLTKNTPFDLKFSQIVFPSIPNLLYYILEESLANLIAYRCIVKKVDKSSPYVANIMHFMRSIQPFPYSLGVKMGEAEPTSAMGSISREIQAYIRNWYRAKKGAPICDVITWARLVLDKPSFTADDLKEQCKTLFNKGMDPKGKGSSKYTKFL